MRNRPAIRPKPLLISPSIFFDIMKKKDPKAEKGVCLVKSTIRSHTEALGQIRALAKAMGPEAEKLITGWEHGADFPKLQLEETLTKAGIPSKSVGGYYIIGG